MIEKKQEVIDIANGFVQVENFSKCYPDVNSFILNEQKNWDDSRDGGVKEILDFKTTILNPYRRLVGGQGRNLNVFFLLAEAMWIFAGRKDVEFLCLFNKKMSDFSDDGNVFHAPYGFRLRHWDVRSEDKYVEENMHAAQGYDQVADAIKIFENNPNSRQVVMAIWNPNFDLGANTRDIPCNDLVMMKIRNGKLYTTIQNRSNDLHWGLPTNIFQFGFLSELMANILGVTLGTQTHNSHSLHVYDWNDIASTMLRQTVTGDIKTLYDYDITEIPMDIKFDNEVAGNRLREVDVMINRILAALSKVSRGEVVNDNELNDVLKRSKWFRAVYRLLSIYLIYKQGIKTAETADEKRNEAGLALHAISEYLEANMLERWDVGVLAQNFFARKINMTHQFLGTL